MIMRPPIVGKRWSHRHSAKGRAARAFTLLEMLIVLIIIAIIAGLALPHIRGNSESAAINAACRQLVADLSLARQTAIAQRSTVAVLFVSPEVQSLDLSSPGWSAQDRQKIKELQGGVYTRYAFYQYRRVGEQPGTRETSGYISEWKALPDKTFIDPDEFLANTSFFKVSPNNPQPKFHFPFTSSPVELIGTYGLPYIAFDHEGRCVVIDRDETGSGLVIGTNRHLNIATGAILVNRDAQGVVTDFEVQQIPPYNATNNVIEVDVLTGRARRLELQLQ